MASDETKKAGLAGDVEASKKPKAAAASTGCVVEEVKHQGEDRYFVKYKVGKKEFSCNVRKSSLQVEVKRLEVAKGKAVKEEAPRLVEMIEVKQALLKAVSAG